MRQSENFIPFLAFGAVLIALLVAAGFLMPRNESAETADSGVVINELMSANVSACAPVDGVYYDWIELYNRSGAAVDLSGWKIADSVDLRNAYQLPRTVLQPGEYLLVYAAGRGSAVTADYFASFGLSSEGETLVLMNADGQTADSVDFPPLNVGETYARDPETDVWTVTESYTPGAANTQENYLAAVEPELAEGDVIINELMAANASTLRDSEGDFTDWIELYNRSAVPVSLNGWTITDDVRNRAKWTFPDVQIGAGEYMLLFASGDDRTDAALHANFSLSNGGETVYLFDASGTLVSRAKYGELATDVSLSRTETGVYTTQLAASPRYPNTEIGARQSRGTDYKNLADNAVGLYINEALVSGSETGDWIEIVNTSGAAMDLSGCGLSDDAANPLQWTFPEGTSIAPGQYLLIGMQGSTLGGWQTNFALSDGETVLFSDRNGTAVDKLALYDQISTASYGRADGHAQYRYFRVPTPGAANSAESYAKQASEVEFSVPGGAVNTEAVVLALSAEEGMSIFYTLDGSEPSIDSTVYTEPIVITGTTVVRATAWSEDCLPSPSRASSYLFGASHTVRIVSVSGPAEKLNGESGVLMTGSKAEQVKVHVEMYEPDGTQLISQDCDLEISGMYSRIQFPQKSFKLTARGEYGDNRFRAALFDNRDYTEYKSVVLRATGQDNEQTRMRDSILTSLSADLGLMYQETEVTVVYVNGVYWGHYNLRERINEQSIAQFMGWDDPENIDLLESSSLVEVQGSNDTYKTMISAVRKYGLETDEYIEALRQYVDIESYLDYVALQIYTSNQDLNNVRMYRNAKQDGRWRWIVYDLDLSYQVDQNSIRRWLTSGGVGSITEQDNTLFIALMKNEKMYDYFLTRMGELLATTFSAQNVLAKVEERYQILEPEMGMHAARWGWSVDQWQRFGQSLTNYAKSRPVKLIGYFQETFNLTDAQMEHYFGEAMRKAEEIQ